MIGAEAEFYANRAIAALQSSQPREEVVPIPMILTCVSCGARHYDEGEFATKPHHTHACQNCGVVWRPAKEPTVGVRFLPDYKNAPPIEQENTEERECSPVEIKRRLAEIEAERAAMPPAEREALEKRELEAQRESWIRAMAPCEHGVADFEECAQCRGEAQPRSPVEVEMGEYLRRCCEQSYGKSALVTLPASALLEAAEALSQSPAIDPRVEELRGALAKCQARLLAHSDRMTLDIQAIDAADTALAAFGGKTDVAAR